MRLVDDDDKRFYAMPTIQVGDGTEQVTIMCKDGTVGGQDAVFAVLYPATGYLNMDLDITQHIVDSLNATQRIVTCTECGANYSHTYPEPEQGFEDNDEDYHEFLLEMGFSVSSDLSYISCCYDIEREDS